MIFFFSGEKLGTRPTFIRSHESFQTENIHTLPGGLFSSCEAALLEFRVHWPYILPFILVRTLGIFCCFHQMFTNPLH